MLGTGPIRPELTAGTYRFRKMRFSVVILAAIHAVTVYGSVLNVTPFEDGGADGITRLINEGKDFLLLIQYSARQHAGSMFEDVLSVKALKNRTALFKILLDRQTAKGKVFQIPL